MAPGNGEMCFMAFLLGVEADSAMSMVEEALAGA
jgi:hypothetical protein